MMQTDRSLWLFNTTLQVNKGKLNNSHMYNNLSTVFLYKELKGPGDDELCNGIYYINKGANEGGNWEKAFQHFQKACLKATNGLIYGLLPCISEALIHLSKSPT